MVSFERPEALIAKVVFYLMSRKYFLLIVMLRPLLKTCETFINFSLYKGNIKF